jgi:hypothetical protein
MKLGLAIIGLVSLAVGLQCAVAQSPIWTTGIGPADNACYYDGTYPSQADIEQDAWNAEMYNYLNYDYTYVPYSRPYDYSYGYGWQQPYGYNQLTKQYPSWAMPYGHSWQPY